MKIFWISLLLALSTPALAVTEFIVTVNHTGEDYNLISTAESALDGVDLRETGPVKCGSFDNQSGSDIADAAAVTWDAGASDGTLHHMTGSQYMLTVTTGSLADNDTVTDATNSFDVAGTPDSCQVTIHLYDDQGELSDGFAILGTTSDEDNFVHITAPDGERHDGTYATGASISATTSIGLREHYARISWIIFKSEHNSATNSQGIQNFNGSDEDNVTIENSIFYQFINLGVGDWKAIQVGNGHIFNNVIIDSGENGDSCISLDAYISDTVRAYNNTILNCADSGITATNSNGLDVIKNNLVLDSAVSDYSGSFDGAETNASSDTSGSAGLQNFVSSDELVSTTGGSEDTHLKSGASSIDAGTDLASLANIEIDGRDRDVEADTWDVGADEFVSAGGAGDTSAGTILYGDIEIHGGIKVY